MSNVPASELQVRKTEVRSEMSNPIFAWERGRLWVLDLVRREPSEASSHLKVSATFAEIHLNAAETLADAMALSDRKLIQRRLEAGKRCFTGRVDGRLAAYCWVSRSAECIGEIEHEIHFQPDEVYIWDCATLPEFRRKGLYTALLGYMIRQLRREGLHRLWIGSALNNHASMHGFSRNRFQPVADLIFMRIFQLSILWVRGVPLASKDQVASARRILTATWPHKLGPFAYDFPQRANIKAKQQPACEDQAA